MIEAHVGLPGSGKSIHAVRKLLAAKAAKRRALANFHSRTGSWEFGLWADITDATNCLVVIDEAHMWFSAREWTKTHQAELSYFQQSRKEGLDLIWVAQHQKRVDTAINELTAYIWDHRRIGGWIVARQYPADDLKRSIGRAVFRLDPRLHRHYWSEERIGFRDGSGYGFGASAALLSGAKGAAPELDGRCRLLPNLLRLEYPLGGVTWQSARPGPDQSALVTACVRSWIEAGKPRAVHEVVTFWYRAVDGLIQRIKDDGTLEPLAEAQGVLEEAVRGIVHDAGVVLGDLETMALARVRRALNGAKPVESGPKPKPVAVLGVRRS